MQPSAPHGHSQPEKTNSFLYSNGLLMGSLLAANLITILLFVLQDGSVIQALWIYWIQSVIIGLANVFRLATFRLDFTNLKINGRQVSIGGYTGQPAMPEAAARVFMTGFFLVHYGFFHVGYAAFLVMFGTGSMVEFNGAELPFSFGTASLGALILPGIVFACHHFISLVKERNELNRSHAAPVPVGKVMMRPYVRIVPMHLIILFGPVLAWALGSAVVFAVFMVLKTVADLILFSRGSGHAMPKAQVAAHELTHRA